MEQELEQIRAGKAKQLEQARLQATRILETTTAQSNELLTELEQLRKEKEKASFSAGVTAAKSHSKQKLRKLYDLANPLEERAPSTYQLPVRFVQAIPFGWRIPSKPALSLESPIKKAPLWCRSAL